MGNMSLIIEFIIHAKPQRSYSLCAKLNANNILRLFASMIVNYTLKITKKSKSLHNRSIFVFPVENNKTVEGSINATIFDETTGT